MSAHRENEADRIASVYAKRQDGGRYSLFSMAHRLMLQETEGALLDLLGGTLVPGGVPDLAPARVLDVGCGGGYWLRRMLDWGVSPANLCGIDLLPDRVERARTHLPAAADVRLADAQVIPWPDDYFQIVTQFVMFSSVLDAEVRAAIAREMIRVKAPDGCILWYDFHVDNPRNPDVKGMRRGEIERLFPGHQLRMRRVNLAPPLARALLPRYRVLYNASGWLPWARTHWAGVLTEG